MKNLWEKIKNQAWKFKIIIIKIKYYIWFIKILRVWYKFYLRISAKKINRRISSFNFYKLPLILLTFFGVAIFALYYLYTYWISAPDFWGLTEIERKAEEIHSEVIRNRGWLAWMGFSLVGLLAGIVLTTWGRIIQHKSHLHDRLEKATTMLGNQAMSMRIAGCRLLMSLGIEDKNMKVLCVRLLFTFINNPYLKEEDEDKNPNDLFSDAEKPLRPDIQEAANSFSAIYNHYWRKGIDNDPVDLPLYFWKNQYKNYISLIKANLQGADLQGANLRQADLQGAILTAANLQGAKLIEADLQGAYLEFVNLQDADLSNANLEKTYLNCTLLQDAILDNVNLREANLIAAQLQGANLKEVDLQGAYLELANVTNAKMDLVKNLTKEQVLSTKWSSDGDEKGAPPTLPEKLMDDPFIKKWLSNPNYNNEKLTKIILENIREKYKRKT